MLESINILILRYLFNCNVTDVANNNDYIFIVKDYVFLRWKDENTTEKRDKHYVLVSTENLDKFLEDNRWMEIN